MNDPVDARVSAVIVGWSQSGSHDVLGAACAHGCGERGRTMDDIKIKVALEFSISESDLEDALAELDEISVDSLITQILDKSIAVDHIRCKVVEGPNTLEEVDELRSASHPS